LAVLSVGGHITGLAAIPYYLLYEVPAISFWTDHLECQLDIRQLWGRRYLWINLFFISVVSISVTSWCVSCSWHLCSCWVLSVIVTV